LIFFPSSSSLSCVFDRTTKDDKNAGNFADLVRAVKGSHTGTRLGFPVKDCALHPGVEGNLAAVWLKHAADKAGLATVEVGRGLSAVMALKDDSEVSDGGRGGARGRQHCLVYLCTCVFVCVEGEGGAVSS
jgi:hypothetical protein